MSDSCSLSPPSGLRIKMLGLPCNHRVVSHQKHLKNHKLVPMSVKYWQVSRSLMTPGPSSHEKLCNAVEILLMCLSFYPIPKGAWKELKDMPRQTKILHAGQCYLNSYMNPVHLCWCDSSRFLPFIFLHFFSFAWVIHENAQDSVEVFCTWFCSTQNIRNSLSGEATARQHSSMGCLQPSNQTGFRRVMVSCRLPGKFGKFLCCLLGFLENVSSYVKSFRFFGAHPTGWRYLLAKNHPVFRY